MEINVDEVLIGIRDDNLGVGNDIDPPPFAISRLVPTDASGLPMIGAALTHISDRDSFSLFR